MSALIDGSSVEGQAQHMERIGEYLVRRLVGEGGMGKVYEAEERLSKRRVALKVLRQELARSEEGRRLFLNEMNILAHLDHPNVVRALACTEHDGSLVMTLEFLDGRTLRDVLSGGGRLSWTDAVSITTQVASALVAAHEKDPPIIHRDLKPENIMVLETGRIKVMDFGIAKVLQALSRTTTQSVGTLQYMSPEQIDAVGVDARSDLYCLGLVLYEMLSGKAPFESASPRELLNMQCTEPPPPLPDDIRRGLPKGVENLLFELLEKDPDDRPGAAQDVLHELEPFASADGEPTVLNSGKRRATTEPGVPIENAHTEIAASTERLVEASRSGSTQPMSEVSPAVSGRGPDSGEAVHTPSPASPKRSPRAERVARAAEKAAGKGGSTDTIALVEQSAASGRSIPTGLGVALIVGLSMIAGLITYLARGGSDEAPVLPASATVPAASSTGP